MYSNNDPHGWEIRTREGKLIADGFSNYQQAARLIPWRKRGEWFPVRSR